MGFREIIFKAKRIDNGEWIYWNLWGELIRESGKRTRIVVKNGATTSYYDYVHQIRHLIDESTISQYTGLCDKNGRKIWENDIVKYHFGDEVAPIRFGEYQSCFDSAQTGHVGFYVDWDSKNALRKDLGYWVNMIDCNVIGNVLDNPELLEGN